MNLIPWSFSPPGRNVAEAWKTMLDTKLEGNSMIGICCEDLVTEVGLMCRSCFSAYDRFSKLKENRH